MKTTIQYTVSTYVCTCVSGSKVAVQRTKNMDDLEPTIAFDLSTLNR